MTDTAERTATDDPIAEVKAWLDENWDPDLTVGEWWERLGTAGWSAPTWPAEWYGRGLAREDAVRAGRRSPTSARSAPPGGLGLLLAGPTIVTHGTDEQKQRYLRDIVTGQKAWCQLFSEPGAGSDLAGLQRQRGQGRRRVDRRTARRCGPRAARSPTSACSSPAPTPTCPSTRASPTSPSTCTSPASTCARSGR